MAFDCIFKYFLWNFYQVNATIFHWLINTGSGNRMSQSWPRSLPPCDVSRPQWVDGACHSGPRFNIKMSSYQYRKSHCGDKTVVRSSYLHNGISYTGKTATLYWFSPLVPVSMRIHLYLRNPYIGKTACLHWDNPQLAMPTLPVNPLCLERGSQPVGGIININADNRNCGISFVIIYI